ncbi:putative Transmembrane protein [Quillaja saponaria]|uniref:Transmembrane protein n=1 Tax=Quillaja saponaria TaxID=32244 RepID=A0AAD7LXZ6_QUISA|nr:putative Transmembrane protein [Quillaja saponaria]
MALISALCVRFRKKSSPPLTSPDILTTDDIDKCSPTSPLEMETTATTTTPPPPQTTEVAGAEAEDIRETEDKDTKSKELQLLQLPLAMKQTGDPDARRNIKKSRSERRLSMNLSMKMPRSLSVARNWDQKKGKFKSEDSVWKKTIILGGKCKVPDEEDAVIYDCKGNKIPAYHPRTTSSISAFSRQSSFTDPDALPCPQPQEQKVS